MRIVAQHVDHPALEIFNDRSGGNLADGEISSWYQLGRPARPSESNGGAVDDGESVVLARLESGDPLIVERRFGLGLVVQVATACDADWSNLPMQPVYLPLMQQLITTMATQVTPKRNIATGEPAVAMLPGEAAGAPLALTAPDGTRYTVRPKKHGSRSVVEFYRTGQPGVYTLTGLDARPIHFVAQAPRSESDLRLLDEKELNGRAEDLGADVVASADEFLQLDRTRRHGREIWRYLFLGVLALLFLEVFLQQRFARVRT
jgi:hypothetical protein